MPPDTTEEELTGWHLSVALAEALGWSHLEKRYEVMYFGFPPMSPKFARLHALPAYHESLDALFRDVVPVLRERGWIYELSDNDLAGTYALVQKGLAGQSVTGQNPAVALAQVALWALRSESDANS